MPTHVILDEDGKVKGHDGGGTFGTKTGRLRLRLGLPLNTPAMRLPMSLEPLTRLRLSEHCLPLLTRVSL
jgi:hypothetical protein